MSEDDFIKFMRDSGQPEEYIEEARSMLSALGTRQLLEPTGWVKTDVEWEEIASIRRKDLVEGILLQKAGGASIGISEL